MSACPPGQGWGGCSCLLELVAFVARIVSRDSQFMSSASRSEGKYGRSLARMDDSLLISHLSVTHVLVKILFLFFYTAFSTSSVTKETKPPETQCVSIQAQTDNVQIATIQNQIIFMIQTPPEELQRLWFGFFLNFIPI